MKKRNDPGRSLLRISLKKGRAEPEGEISGMELPKDVRFFGYADMTEKIGRIYDLLGYQVPEERSHSGANAGESPWEGTILAGGEGWGTVFRPMKPLHPGIPAVYLTTLYRKNRSWQGYIRLYGSGEKREIPFRNAGELARLLEAYREETSQDPQGDAMAAVR